MLRHAPLVLALSMLGGCEAPVDEDDAAPKQPLPPPSGFERSCDIAAPLPDGGFAAVDTSATPRANVSAEVLALEASGEFIAPTALYQRVAYELGALSERWPDLAHGQVLGCGVPGDLFIQLTDVGIQQVDSGEYHAWDEYNAALRLTGIQSFTGGRTRLLSFSGIYNHATLARAYDELPEIDGGGPALYIGASRDACLEQMRDESDTHIYIFWQGSGDCPSGCIDKVYNGFVTDATGRMEYLGRHVNREAEPEWFAGARQCRNFLS